MFSRMVAVSKKDDFSSNVDKLHSTVGQINSGLKDIVSTIDDIAKNNVDLITSDADHSTDDAEKSVTTLLSSIRQQIKDVVSHSQQFENIIDEYASGIDDLSQQLEHSRQSSLLDPVTGISNRTSLAKSLKTTLGELDKFNNEVSLLLADIDKFKNVNEELGQNIGDQVLRLVASNFAFNLDDNDILGRWGGDEFAAILPGTDMEDAYEVAEKVRKSIAKRSLRKQKTGETMGKVTLSIGVSTYRKDDTDKDLLSRADTALQTAKNTGRNRTIRETN